MTTVFMRGDHVELAEALISTLGDPIIGDLGSLFTYDAARGVWTEIAPSRQSKIVQDFAGCPCGDRAKPLQLRSNDISGAMRLAFDRVVQPDFFKEAPVGIAFANGFVRVDDAGLSTVPHASENRCRFAYPFELAGEPSEAWVKFLRGLFRDDKDSDEKIACLGEFFGGAVLGIATRYQQAVIAKGGGDQGKSTLAKIIIAAMPPGSICAIAPQDMGQEYRRAMIAGKRLNVVNELPEASIIASEAFKAIVAGDPITGRHIREKPFTFSPEAAHYFAANRLPGTNDQTEGFWRRLILLEFNRFFKGDPERETNIADRIIREHLPGVVRWMLDGAARLIRQGHYTLPSSHAKAIAEWRLSADPVALFLEECATIDPNAQISSTKLYALYRDWAHKSGHKNIPSSTTFGMRLRNLKIKAEHHREGNYYPLRLNLPGGA